eukprot:CAMPEP_0181027922 /NCGR_PEP_ID=MMETSP1070-20121207/4408_1 /TAXON_ID=265543 /ORGANISM="Minutocellus polymorphus, Strain NH13" /LENGTH=92 /DNA_ID=CAMNT_0023105167 /DNA_START=125 /DNA_END=400 /DNA_ORIENTATION=+
MADAKDTLTSIVDAAATSGSGHEEAEAASAAASYAETQNTGEGFVQLQSRQNGDLVLFCQGQHLCWKWEIGNPKRFALEVPCVDFDPETAEH